MILVVGILAATTALSAQLSAYLALRSRGSKSALAMALVMGATAWWAAGNALEYLPPGLPAKLAFADLQYLAIAFIPVFWFLFGWLLGKDDRPPQGGKWRWLLGVIPAVTAVLVWTDPLLGLMRHSFRLEVQSGINVIAKDFGPWFWVHSAYSYALIIAGTVFILRSMRTGGATGKAQRVMLVVGTLLPVAANLLYLSKAVPLGSIDPTPLAFSLTGLLLVVNLARFRFLSLMTAAPAAAIEQLRDAVLIFDRHGRLAYANDVARVSGLAEPGPHHAGLPLAADQVQGGSGADTVLSHRGLLLERRSGAIVRHGRRIGSVTTFFDVTRRVTAEEELRKSNLLLELRVEERTRDLTESNRRLTAELENRTRAERQLTHDVLHDPLTGLANRSLALNRIEQLLARGRRDPAAAWAVLHVDFDGFKTINERFGRGAGDAFLCEAAARLKRSVRESDLAARLGADEFLVVLDGFAAGTLDEITDRVVDSLSVPFSFGAGAVIPSAGIGVVVGTAGSGNPQSILEDAEIALLRAKATGKNAVTVFSEEMRRKVDEGNLLAASLRTAIANGGISLAYQPIVRRDGSTAGWEVLARWRHEQLGPIGPDRFIPIAEESGLIIPMGAYILIEALKTAAALRGEGLLDDGGGDRFFAVNVSAIQFGQGDFADFVLSAADRMGLPRSILHLELTESAIMENRAVATSVIQRLSSEGIGFKLDDFGTGYSSLEYLHRIPIDCVKIDRGFISRLDSSQEDGNAAAIVSGMITLCHGLRKSVVAEGIENGEQARALWDYGCDFCQGYHFGRPMDAAALFETLRAARSPSGQAATGSA
jgi:diguanylate cyclase (GGDEF)-like protein